MTIVVGAGAVAGDIVVGRERRKRRRGRRGF